ncbi:glycosyltransferase family 2 protein [Salinimicrobium terrae]|uniref:glycosyltransferase family 2 protein n=1 Tax=Salinimicrobium terrae TaxID=470866 RepID=UPI00048B36C4|nr:glycosyltransferase [Salinimicrobium terrae]
MVSIITAIYNQKSMNELFYKTLKENTHYPFELIIVDNNSTDRCNEFFAQKDNVVLVENNGNYNYPYNQIVGLKRARHEVVCLFNNDIWYH